ncbi:MAG: hypothetical protein ACREVD_01320, partial [Burkholderiales bacterium]
GTTGRNFAAGMSGGIAYVYDEDGQFSGRCNTAMVALDKLLPKDEQQAGIDAALWHRGQADETQLRKLVEDHHRWTGSLRARHILDHWVECRTRFVKVFPHEYKRALQEIAAKEAVRGELSASKQADATIAKARASDKKPSRVVPAK